MTFRVGMKVVCVDASEESNTLGWCGDVPDMGAVYTVAAIVYVPSRDCDGLVLDEIKNGVFDGAYNPRRFRPIVSRKTDISIFTAMLNPSKQEIDA